MATLKLLPALLLTVGCVAPAPPASGPVADAYFARGQEPGWTVTITSGRIDYVGNYGEKRISLSAPAPRTTFNGHRYETERLTIDITHVRCNDAMSGQGYADQVMIIADGETYRGCGGTRRPDWDQ